MDILVKYHDEDALSKFDPEKLDKAPIHNFDGKRSFMNDKLSRR